MEEEIKYLHSSMLKALHDHLSSKMETEWNKFTSVLPMYLTPADIAGVTTMFEVCNMLEEKGRISYGKYDKLKELFCIIRNQTCIDIVDKYSTKMYEKTQDHRAQSEKRAKTSPGDVREQRRNVDQEIQQLHSEMFLELNNHLSPNIQEEWKVFKFALKVFLSAPQIADVTTMLDVHEMLTTTGTIRLGEYDNLKTLFSMISNQTCCDIVDTYSAKMKEFEKQQNRTELEKRVKTSPGDVREQSSTTAVGSHASDPSMIMVKKMLNISLFKAIIGRDKDETKRLLDANIDPLLLDEFWITPFHMALDTKQVDIVKLISTVICKQFKSYIQSRYGNLLYKTWMGYTLEQGYVDQEESFQNICIVGIYTKQPPCTLCEYFRHIPIRWRQIQEVSDEGKLTTQFENIGVNSENKISPALAKTLFNEHSNLTILHYSSVKSKDFPTELRKIVKTPCIALYCHIKGIIPLGEKQFKETISAFGAYEIDVREGYCYLNQSHIRPGTAIYCPTFIKYGTAGGFVEDSLGNTAMVTAAHIVTDCALRRYNGFEKQEFLSRKDIEVLENSNSELIGKVKTWCFENRNFDQTSVDAAVIEVDRTMILTDSMFPDTSQRQWNQAGYTSSNLPRMCTNKLITREEISSNRRLDVIKYGMSTKITIGNIIYDGAYFKPHREEVHADDISPFNMKYDSDDYIMCHQLGVQGRGGQPFSKAGDSGAFCCMIDNNDETVVRAFGMVIAGSTSGVSFVTPLEDVFQALGLDFSKGLKSFSQDTQTQGSTTNQSIQGATANQPMSNAYLDPILQQLQLLNASFQQMVSKQEQMATEQQEMASKQEQIVSKQQEMVLEQQHMRQTFDARFHLQDQKIDTIMKNRNN